jgi:oxygen-independent coproporphyrinogen-3 oxidase
LRSLGINRLSLGVQSFYDEDLKFLSRIHTADDVFQIVKDTNDANFNNISFDLIFSLPEQTIEKWKSNLQKAVELHPTHISCYSLIIEPETPLFTMVHSKGVSVLSEENDAELYEFTIEFLNNNGYRQYEVSNFAKSGFESVHNKNYWNHIPYIGLGPSSHSFFNTKRWWNFRNIDRYIESLNNNILPIESEEVLTKQQMINEFIYLGLRSEGINLNKLKESYCTDLLPIKKNLIENFVNGNLMICDGSYLKLTPTGYVMCDEICAELAL